MEYLQKIYPDPITHFQQVIVEMNEERKVNSAVPVSIGLFNHLEKGWHNLKMYEDPQLDIFWMVKFQNRSFHYDTKHIFLLLVISKVTFSASKKDICFSFLIYRIRMILIVFISVYSDNAQRDQPIKSGTEMSEDGETACFFLSFNDIIGFNNLLKVVNTVKQLKPEAEAVLRDLFEKVPGIRNFAAVKAESSALRGELSLYDGKTLQIHAVLLDRATPKIVAEKIAGLNEETEYPIIMAPYISEASANLCEAAGVGFCDYSGNCLIRFHTLYISSKGNPNRYPAKDHAKTLFSPSAQTTSRILRELMKDVSRTWKLKTLSETVGCSIGMVSRVKTFLCEQRWAVMDSAGLRLTDPESLLKEWSRAYSVGSTVSCYTLDSLPDFEEKCFRAYQDGLELCMTGISGGVRYTPVVRYAKAHIWIRPQDVTSFFQKTGCREVDSGANIVLYLAPGDEVFADSREVNGSRVASPVQVYLDCMQIKGRGEEMAEAVYAKEIRK